MSKNAEILEIELKGGRRGIYANPSAYEIERDDYVIVEADRGEDIGYVVQKGSLVDIKCRKRKLKPDKLRKVVRPATEEDVERIDRRDEREKEAYQTCKRKIGEHNLPMKLVDVEIQFDNSKITFYFTADHRVDFRELVKDLASVYRTRIELRQIGVRDEARRVGGHGICGLKQCCSAFIQEFEQIATHMARDQQLSLNPAKISGNCGRLLCCLRYELDHYQEMSKVCPTEECRVRTAKGEGIARHPNLLKGQVTIRYESGEEETIPCEQCEILTRRRGKRGKSDKPEKPDKLKAQGGKPQPQAEQTGTQPAPEATPPPKGE